MSGDLEAGLGFVPVSSPLRFNLQKDPIALVQLSGTSWCRNGFTMDALGNYIDQAIASSGVSVAAGGYLEDRSFYLLSEVFFQPKTSARTLHLGVDLWCKAGEAVFAVADGEVHSMADNHAFGNYGPTIILQHQANGHIFHTLYGHLSRSSLQGIKVNQSVRAGQRIGWLGHPSENVGWPPHLHFQVIKDMKGFSGDYPGVCAPAEKALWADNSPDPNLLLRIPGLQWLTR